MSYQSRQHFKEILVHLDTNILFPKKVLMCSEHSKESSDNVQNGNGNLDQLERGFDLPQSPEGTEKAPGVAAYTCSTSSEEGETGRLLRFMSQTAWSSWRVPG